MLPFMHTFTGERTVVWHLLLRSPEMAGRKNHCPHRVHTYTSFLARGRLS